MSAFVAALLLSFIPAFTYAAILYWLDRFEKEPRRMLVGAFLWGAVVSTFGAIVWSSIFEVGVGAFTGPEIASEIGGPVIIAPIVEESLKGLAVLIIFLAFRHEFDSTLDGMVYAGITALGFAATENVLYLFFLGYGEDGWGGLITLFVLRVILGGWGHAVYTAFIGIGLARARLSRNRAVQVLAPILGWAAAVGLHALHNGMATFIAGAGLDGLVALLLVDWVSWLVVLLVVIWEIRRERGWIATYLQEEVAGGVISRAQYERARSLRALFGLRGGGATGRRFFQLCAELAQKKHQLATRGDEGGNQARIAQIRGDLARLSPGVVVA